MAGGQEPRKFSKSARLVKSTHVYQCHRQLKGEKTLVMITIGRQVGEALVLAPLPLAVADVEVNLHGAGYSLVPVGWDLHNQRTL